MESKFKEQLMTSKMNAKVDSKTKDSKVAKKAKDTTKTKATKAKKKEPKLTINGYTKEFEQWLLNGRKELLEDIRDGKARFFSSHAEFEKALENGEI